MFATNALSSMAAEGPARRAPIPGAKDSTDPAAKAQFSQDQFLTMMLAQLKNQDPLKPMEPGEFLGQLAQFSTVTGVQDVNKSVAELASSLRGSQVVEGATLIGRSVLAAGTAGRLAAGGEPVRGAVGSPTGTNAIEVSVRDSAGAVVRRLHIPPQEGLAEFQWDGATDIGTRAAPGEYRFEAVGRVGGRAESLEMLIQQRVTSVTIDTNGRGLTLNTQSGALALGDVRRVL